ncbi:hypothetical protein [Bradyrhizobium sp.]|uniref:hypothetical protein n=1 Tax=Bradyrhizobium sp. TaxID=376 RepID=UPI003C5D7CFE
MTDIVETVGPITEQWLKDAGFKWHQLDRQPDKHWLLWLGAGLKEKPCLTSFEDIGIELAPNRGEDWFCWLRSDAAGRYHRFIHLRHVQTVGDVIALVEAISGRPWTPANHFYGSLYSPEGAERVRKDIERADRRMQLDASEHNKWFGIEKDDTRGRALPEHMQAAEKAREKK